LKPGSNTIWFTSKGPGGDVRVAKCDITVPAPVVVAEAPAEPAPAPAEPAPAEPAPAPEVVIPARPFDCVATLGRLNQVFPIRFEFDRDDLQGISSLSVSQYAALLKDARCADLKVELGGHADFRGGVTYNQDLSERRANQVLKALTDAGIDTSRMTPKGFSELVPFDPATTDEARAKNRRVEVTVIKN
jgi:outer membrane protein OmpA-like peptidoglycan-associated protein